MNILAQQNSGQYSLANSLLNASNVFQRISKKIDKVTSNPLTKQIEKRVPEITPYLNKTNQISRGLEKTSNGLEKAQKKLAQIEKIKYM